MAEIAALAGVLDRARPFFKHLAVPDQPFAGVRGQFEILRQFQGIHGAGVLAKSAKHTARQVVSEVDEVFSAGLLVALADDDDEIFGACNRTKVARNAESFPVFGIDVQPGRAAVTFGNSGAFQWILIGDPFVGALALECNPQTFD